MSMLSTDDRRDDTPGPRLGLAANMALAVGLAAIGNGVIALFGWHAESHGAVSPAFAPPGIVIGAVWTALFAAMGAARWLAVRDGSAEARIDGWLVTILILACFAYPYYTLGLRDAAIGLVGSLATMGFATIVAGRLHRRAPLAAVLVGATAAWCAFASVVLYRTLQLNP